MSSWNTLKRTIRGFSAMTILGAIVSMFVILSCHGESMQFRAGFGFHADSQSCQEHLIQAGDIHTEKSIFDGVTLPEVKSLVATLFVAVFFVLFPKLPERYTRLVKVALIYNQRKRWVWARNLPFSSMRFYPYFAAQRDH